MMTAKQAKRFWNYVKIGAPNDCWEWVGMLTPFGYGKFKITTNVSGVAHRLIYIEFHGEIPDDLCVCHRCDNPSCVNPSHLFLGTKSENAIDRHSKNRDARGEKHGRAKLTELQVTDIRSDRRTLKEIAKEYGVDFTTIGDIKNRRLWKHLI